MKFDFGEKKKISEETERENKTIKVHEDLLYREGEYFYHEIYMELQFTNIRKQIENVIKRHEGYQL